MIPSDRDIILGESGIQFKEYNGQQYIFISYGDDMIFHAAHAWTHVNIYPEVAFSGFKIRDVPLPRSQTLGATRTEHSTPLHRDEYPPRILSFAEGQQTVMLVPPGESSMQGTLEQQAKLQEQQCKGGCIVKDFDNRKDKNNAHVVGRLERGPPNIPALNDDPRVPWVRTPESEVKKFLYPIPHEVMPKVLQDIYKGVTGIDNLNRRDTTNGDLAYSLAKRSAASLVYTYSPFYNQWMEGDDIYSPYNQSQISKRQDARGLLNNRRGLLDEVSTTELQANDTSEAQLKEVVLEWLYMKEVIQSNLTSVLQTFTDAVLNGSSNPLAEAQAWSLYSILTPNLSIKGPFMGQRDYFQDLGKNFSQLQGSNDSFSSYQNYTDAIGDFNTFVYQRAVASLNRDGLLDALNLFNKALATTDPSYLPDDQWTIDTHDHDNFIDYLQQWYEYNEIPFTPQANTTNATEGVTTPDWIFDTLGWNVTALSLL